MLYARGTVEVQGFRCLIHGDDEALDDAVANWASISGSRSVTSGEISAEGVKDILDEVVDVSTYSAWINNRFPLSRIDIESLSQQSRRVDGTSVILLPMPNWWR